MMSYLCEIEKVHRLVEWLANDLNTNNWSPYILIFRSACGKDWITIGNVIWFICLAAKVKMIPWFAFDTRLLADSSGGNYRRFQMTACRL